MFKIAKVVVLPCNKQWKDDFEKIKSEIINNICSKNKKETLSYVNSLITLLNIKQKEMSTNFIANQRYHNLKISDISFSNELPDFYESFCE